MIMIIYKNVLPLKLVTAMCALVLQCQGFSGFPQKVTKKACALARLRTRAHLLAAAVLSASQSCSDWREEWRTFGVTSSPSLPYFSCYMCHVDLRPRATKEQTRSDAGSR